MALARTDYGFQWHFEDEAEKYRVTLNTSLNMNIAENAKGIEGYKASADLWATLPQFQYHWQSPGSVLRDHLFEYAILIGWAIFSFFTMLLACRKINVF